MIILTTIIIVSSINVTKASVSKIIWRFNLAAPTYRQELIASNSTILATSSLFFAVESNSAFNHFKTHLILRVLGL